MSDDPCSYSGGALLWSWLMILPVCDTPGYYHHNRSIFQHDIKGPDIYYGTYTDDRGFHRMYLSTWTRGLCFVTHASKQHKNAASSLWSHWMQQNDQYCRTDDLKIYGRLIKSDRLVLRSLLARMYLWRDSVHFKSNCTLNTHVRMSKYITVVPCFALVVQHPNHNVVKLTVKLTQIHYFTQIFKKI